MKSAVIFYHKNLHTIYPQHWIDKCVSSIAAQTYKDFDVIELNYGDISNIFNGDIKEQAPLHFYAKLPGHKYEPICIPMENHITAMNYLLNYCFKEKGYDVVFNTNMDDFYHPTRFAKQIEKIEAGFDIVTSDFCYIEEQPGPGNDVFTEVVGELSGIVQTPLVEHADRSVSSTSPYLAEMPIKPPTKFIDDPNFTIGYAKTTPTWEQYMAQAKTMEQILANAIYAHQRANQAQTYDELSTITINVSGTIDVSNLAQSKAPSPLGKVSAKLTEGGYNNHDVVTRHMRILQYGAISANLAKNHNVIAHPAVAFNKTFWTDGIQYENVLGKEDLLLWQKTIKMGKKFCIIDEELLYYRIHTQQTGKLHKA